MSANIKIIKRLMVIAVLTLIATICVNINIETGIIALNTFVLSNNIALTLSGGVCTGVVVVLAEKIYKYYLDKNATKYFLYNTMMMLYSDYYYTYRDIDKLLKNRNLIVPKNLFSYRMPTMQNRLGGIANTDYCVFKKKDKFMFVHNDFAQNKFIKLKNQLDQYIYFQIAYTEMEMKQIMGIENANKNIYEVLNVLGGFSKEALGILNQYLDALQKDSPKKFNWSQNVETIHNSYLGLYNSGNVDEFLKRNLNEVD